MLTQRFLGLAGWIVGPAVVSMPRVLSRMNSMKASAMSMPWSAHHALNRRLRCSGNRMLVETRSPSSDGYFFGLTIAWSVRDGIYRRQTKEACSGID